ncbi:hypothetical protein [Mycoplasmopsis iners]|uniref:hypothetical protein n=1 Tax=Mycoplasmopsis iners TaxID=76630 RepID=UPI000495924F|nr:hypothetical protein [Mycoplasmopsis iners]
MANAKLFDDFVFVLAISQFSKILEHENHGSIVLLDFFKFDLMLVSLISDWTIKTNLSNSYGLS